MVNRVKTLIDRDAILGDGIIPAHAKGEIVSRKGELCIVRLTISEERTLYASYHADELEALPLAEA